jgi:hypothetical protein
MDSMNTMIINFIFLLIFSLSQTQPKKDLLKFQYIYFIHFIEIIWFLMEQNKLKNSPFQERVLVGFQRGGRVSVV